MNVGQARARLLPAWAEAPDGYADIQSDSAACFPEGTQTANAGDRTILPGDALHRRAKRLLHYHHVMSIGMQQAVRPGHDPNMATPEDEITPTERRKVSRITGLSQAFLLHVAVTRGGKAAGLQRKLHKA